MDHGGEQALQVDTFRQAVGGHQDALLCISQLGHSGFALAGCQFASDCLDPGLFELAAQVFRQIVSGSDVAAEDYRLKTLFHQGLQVVGQLGQFGVVGGARQVFCRSNQLLQTCGVFGLGGGLNIVRGQGIVQAIHHALAGLGFQLFQGEFAFFLLTTLEARAQGIDGCGRGGGNATQQGQRCPPVHALLALAFAFGALHQLAGVVQHIVEQLAPGTGQLVGDFRCFAVGEHAGVLPLSNVRATALHKVAR